MDVQAIEEVCSVFSAFRDGAAARLTRVQLLRRERGLQALRAREGRARVGLRRERAAEEPAREDLGGGGRLPELRTHSTQSHGGIPLCPAASVPHLQ